MATLLVTASLEKDEEEEEQEEEAKEGEEEEDRMLLQQCSPTLATHCSDHLPIELCWSLDSKEDRREIRALHFSTRE